jgi:hypothetical protein
MVIVAGPVVSRMSCWRVPQSGTRWPLKATILSRGWSPAALAGESLAPLGHLSAAAEAGTTQAETVPTLVVWVLTPKLIITPTKITTAMTRFMNGPANITITRFHGLRV